MHSNFKLTIIHVIVFRQQYIFNYISSQKKEKRKNPEQTGQQNIREQFGIFRCLNVSSQLFLTVERQLVTMDSVSEIK